MNKIILMLAFLTTATLSAHKEIEVMYHQVDSMYLEAVVNDSLRCLQRKKYKIKDVQYAEVNEFISSFMIIYEKNAQRRLNELV